MSQEAERYPVAAAREEKTRPPIFGCHGLPAC